MDALPVDQTLYAFHDLTYVTAVKDIEQNPITYRATLADDSILPTWLTFNDATETFSGTPANSDVGELSVKFSYHDEATKDNPIVHTFKIIVQENLPPQKLISTVPPVADTPAGLVVSYPNLPQLFSDIEGDAVSVDISVVPSAAWLNVDTSTLLFSGSAPDNNAVADYTITLLGKNVFPGGTLSASPVVLSLKIIENQ